MKRRAFRFALYGVSALAATAFFGFVVMLLWNWILPPVSGWHAITYWQALGLLILSKILFSGFRGGMAGSHWRRRELRRWAQMTPEEREKFREGMRARCGFRPATHSEP